MKGFFAVTVLINGEIETLHVNIDNICYYRLSYPNTIIKLSCGEELVVSENIESVAKAIIENQIK